ncbi:MAG: 30S ribosomal protein S20 [Deltaproteobacteria bacterium]
MAKRIKSGIKKHRQSLKKRERNTSVQSRLKTLVKKLRGAVESKNAAESEAALKTAISAFDKAASKGIIHQKNASRHIGRLSKRVQGLIKPA